METEKPRQLPLNLKVEDPHKTSVYDAHGIPKAKLQKSEKNIIEETPLTEDDTSEVTPIKTEDSIEQVVSKPPQKTGDRFQDKENYEDWLAEVHATKK